MNSFDVRLTTFCCQYLFFINEPILTRSRRKLKPYAEHRVLDVRLQLKSRTQNQSVKVSEHDETMAGVIAPQQRDDFISLRAIIYSREFQTSRFNRLEVLANNRTR